MASVNSLLFTLRSDIENLKQSLCHTNDTIKQIDGRRNGSRFGGPGQVAQVRKRLSSGLITGPPRQRQRINSRNQDKESADEEDDYQIHTTIPSSVVATNKDNHSREEVIRQQNKDKEGIARNRRMFGMLMGTLHQFKVDERRNEQQERKRKEVEKKLEEKQREEEVRMRIERDKLFVTKQQQIIKLRKLELMMGVVELHETWEEQSMQLKHFIRTDSKPNIYYLPKQHNELSLKKLEASRKLIEAIVSKRRNLLNDDIKKILNTEHFDDGDDDDGEERGGGRPARNDKIIRNKRRDSTIMKDHDEFDLDLNRNEAIGVDYQTNFDQSTKQDLPCDDNNNNNDDNDDADDANKENYNRTNNVDDIETNGDDAVPATTATSTEDKVNDDKIKGNGDNDDVNGDDGGNVGDDDGGNESTSQEKMDEDVNVATVHSNDDGEGLPVEKNGEVVEMAAEIDGEKKDGDDGGESKPDGDGDHEGKEESKEDGDGSRLDGDESKQDGEECEADCDDA